MQELIVSVWNRSSWGKYEDRSLSPSRPVPKTVAIMCGAALETLSYRPVARYYSVWLLLKESILCKLALSKIVTMAMTTVSTNTRSYVANMTWVHIVAGSTPLPKLIAVIRSHDEIIYPIYTGPQQHPVGRAMGLMAIGAHQHEVLVLPTVYI